MSVIRTTDASLVDWLKGQVDGSSSPGDILERNPGLTIEDAYALQFALMSRLVAAGDRIIGYKAAYTSRTMQRSFDYSGPAIGTLLRSRYVEDGCPIPIPADAQAIVEAEVAVLLKSDLAGPGVTFLDAISAIEGYLPAAEVALIPPATRSKQMGTAVMKTTGAVTVGGPLHSRMIDLRLEGAVISLNGEVQSSATAVEALGDPVNVVVAMANTIASYGQSLKAGMILMTGSVVPYVKVSPGAFVDIAFTSLGQLHIRLENEAQRREP